MAAKSEAPNPIALIGGGLASLTLAYELLKPERALDIQVTLFDPEDSERLERTWCSWVDTRTEADPWKSLGKESWSELELNHPLGRHSRSITPLRYRKIEGPALHTFLDSELSRNPRFQKIRARVTEVKPAQDLSSATVTASDGRTWQTPLAFVSVPGLVNQPEPNGPLLLQHFLGWRIRTERAVFSPSQATLMDFRLPQGSEVRFVYILPSSPTEALIELTVFSEKRWKTEEYEEALRAWWDQHFIEPGPLVILERETGAIPMITRKRPDPGFYRTPIVPIGTAGLLVKPSTGYALTRILEHSKSIADTLPEWLKRNHERHTFDFSPPKSSRRFSWYDRLLLNQVSNRGGEVNQIFERLFARQPVTRILRFLDEKTHLGEELLIFWSLPWPPFLHALFRVALKELWQSRYAFSLLSILVTFLLRPNPTLSNPLSWTFLATAWVILGIAHGALDHIHEKRMHPERSMVQVLSRYVGWVAALFLALLSFPEWALALFVAVSALHFGETEHPKAPLWLSWAWGFSWLGVAIFLPWQETGPILGQLLSRPEISALHIPQGLPLSFLALGFLSSWAAELHQVAPYRRLAWGRVLTSTLHLAGWYFAFLRLDFFIAFSLFFLLDHSRKSWIDQWRALARPRLGQLAAWSAPTTLGALAVLILAWNHWQNAQSAIFALLAAVTLPHAWVMGRLKIRSARENLPGAPSVSH